MFVTEMVVPTKRFRNTAPALTAAHDPGLRHRLAAAQIGLGWVVWKYRDTADKQRAAYSHGNNTRSRRTLVTAASFGLAVMVTLGVLHLHGA
jgi:hypothetical protein